MKYVHMPLFENELYSYSISLQGQSYIVKIAFNRRQKVWHMDLFTPDEDPVVRGVALVPEYPLTQEYPDLGLSGYFFIEEKPDIVTDKMKQYPELLSKYYRMFYIYKE